jgi:hypothetical protein
MNDARGGQGGSDGAMLDEPAAMPSNWRLSVNPWQVDDHCRKDLLGKNTNSGGNTPAPLI